MCGIFGYIGHRAAAPLLLQGLQRLEYRGYDSAGIGVIHPEYRDSRASGNHQSRYSGLAIIKSVGKLTQLAGLMGQSRYSGLKGTVGLGHTRWATHGAVTMQNAHPHADCSGSNLVVHNGIVENQAELRVTLALQGHTFASETDTEVISHLIEEGLKAGLSVEEACLQAASLLQGANAFVVLSSSQPDTLVALRLGNAGGIIVGHGEDELFLASDLSAILPHTNRVQFLEDGEASIVTREGVSIRTMGGRAVSKPYQVVSLDPMATAKRGFKHFMLKEIMEQPEAVMTALRGRVDLARGAVLLEEEFPLGKEVEQLQRVVLVGCGTSLHAAMVGRYYMERLAGLPAEAEVSSEFRYREPFLGPSTLMVAIGQSGETADTLGAMEEARTRGARLLTICNIPGSQATRLADSTMLMRAGLEVSVASTKTFIASLACLFLLALYLGAQRGHLPREAVTDYLKDLEHLPALMSEVLRASERERLASLARRYAWTQNFLLLGRGLQHPVALEGALKLKEVTYIHAEGVAAGEMKHGPIALVDDNTVVIALAPQDGLYQKMLSNIAEVNARMGKVIALGAQGDSTLAAQVTEMVALPEALPLLNPLLLVVPLQLFAYHIADFRGCDVDQPRNLAKSVTVE
ncbi:MAG: glutamine--fructose-6-phosphate transaminase (isomerizing) [Dehalococcoidia bacterium]